MRGGQPGHAVALGAPSTSAAMHHPSAVLAPAEVSQKQLLPSKGVSTCSSSCSRASRSGASTRTTCVRCGRVVPRHGLRWSRHSVYCPTTRSTGNSSGSRGSGLPFLPACLRAGGAAWCRARSHLLCCGKRGAALEAVFHSDRLGRALLLHGRCVLQGQAGGCTSWDEAGTAVGCRAAAELCPAGWHSGSHRAACPTPPHLAAAGAIQRRSHPLPKLGHQLGARHGPQVCSGGYAQRLQLPLCLVPCMGGCTSREALGRQHSTQGTRTAFEFIGKLRVLHNVSWTHAPTPVSARTGSGATKAAASGGGSTV